MIEFRHILCPIDFSDTSGRALTYATGFATWYEAQLAVLHVAPAFDEALRPGETGPGPYSGSRDDILAKIGRSIERAGAEALNARPLAQEGAPATTARPILFKRILQRAAASDMDLLGMGAQGSGGIELMLYGSNTHHVVRAATCPVLTVRA